jgi:hypothetical protein
MRIPLLRAKLAAARFPGSVSFAVTIVFATLAIRLFWFTNRYAVNIFNLDQWDLNDAVLGIPIVFRGSGGGLVFWTGSQKSE